MMKSICGLDCDACRQRGICAGCTGTKGRPFGGDCVLARCCLGKGHTHCDRCNEKPCELKKTLIREFNALNIEDMESVTSLNALEGAYINLEYTLPSGQAVRFWEDNRVYLGNQLCKKNSDRCYGLVADEQHLLVCEYGADGSDAEIVAFKKRHIE